MKRKAFAKADRNRPRLGSLELWVELSIFQKFMDVIFLDLPYIVRISSQSLLSDS